MCVTVLFNNVDDIMLLYELANSVTKRKSPHAAVVKIDVLLLEAIARFSTRR